MMRPHHAGTAALAVVLVLAACSSTPSGASQNPQATTNVPGATVASEPTSAPVAGEPCSFLTAAEIDAVLGSVPVEVKERAGRGDCDYWLDAAKTSKVNIGVTTGPDGLALFESTKALGDPQPVSLGDEAYSIFLEGTGTVILVRKGDSVVSVQLLTSEDAAAQLVKATALAQAVISGF